MTPRCLAAGLLLSCFVGVAGPYIGIYLQGSNAGGVYYTSPVALFSFIVITGLANLLIGAVHRPWMFRRGELVAVFVMMTLANAGLNPIHYWLGAITGPYYYATAENNWAEILHPSIPDWIAPRDPGSVSAFYEGVEGGSGAIDWQVWAGPILSWMPFAVAFYTVTLCLMVVVRRQWMDRPRAGGSIRFRNIP